MPVFNYSRKEMTAKIVYFGPASSGKATNLHWVHEHLEAEAGGTLLSSVVEGDQTLSVDFLAAALPAIRGMTTRVHLCTASGVVRSEETWGAILKNADGAVFVADSDRTRLSANTSAMASLRAGLLANYLDPDEVALTLQYNKRDSPEAAWLPR